MTEWLALRDYSTVSYPFSEAPEAGDWIEVQTGIYWLRLKLPISLDHINVYLLDDTDGFYLVDTGMKTTDIQQLWEGYFQKLIRDKPLKGVIVTHMHPDHVGLAGWLCEKFRCPLYMSLGEYLFARCLQQLQPGLSWTSEQFFTRHGLKQDYMEYVSKSMAGYGSIVHTLPGAYRRLCVDDVLNIGGRNWQVFIGSGHSAEHVCLYDAENKLLLSGDQLIARISSNVSVMSIEPEANPLANWLDSLERLSTLAAETLTMASHDKPFYGLRARVEQLQQHHHEHLQALLAATSKQAISSLELLPVLFKRDIGFAEMGMALGECLAHLHYLMAQGLLERQERGGLYYYQSV